MSETTEVECDHCHQVKQCEYRDDPYTSEVRGDEDDYEPHPSWWCDDCYSSRHEEV